MRICLFLPSFLPEIGGLEVAADKFALKLRSLGYDIVVFAQRKRGKSIRIDKPYPIIHYERPCSTTLLPFSVGLSLERLHQEYNFDIIHAWHAYLPGYIAVRFKRKYNIPVVISCRGGDVDIRSRYLNRWLPRRRIIWSLKNADAVTAVSDHLARQVRILTDDSVPVDVIRNGVKIHNDGLSDTASSAFSYLKGKDFILTLGRLHITKGLDLLLDAMKILKDQNKTLPRLILAGDGREKHNLQQQVDMNHLTDYVTFAGHVSGSEKAWLLSNCLFFVHPSRHEGFPNSVLEAMSYGKPVLATSAGGLPELVAHERSGLIVETDNITALAVGLEKMLAINLSGYIENAKKIAQEHSLDIVAESYLKLYQSLLGS